MGGNAMWLYTVLVYGVPAVTIGVTLFAGYLGWKFYVDEVVKK